MTASLPGALNPAWTGDAASYCAVHGRLRSNRGKASAHECLHCDRQAAHWAYDHSDPNERADPKCGPYSIDLTRYIPLCVACHRIWDDAPIGHRGKPRSEPMACTVEGCQRLQRTRGWCMGHYDRWRATGHVGPATFRTRDPYRGYRGCSVEGCERPHRAGGMCIYHYNRVLTRGGV